MGVPFLSVLLCVICPVALQLWKPKLVLVLYVVVLLLSPTIFQDWGPWNGITLDMIFLYVAFIAALLKALVSGQPLKGESVILGYALYLAIGVFATLTALVSLWDEWSVSILGWLQGFVRPLLVLLLFYWTVRKPSDVIWVVQTVVLLAIITTVIGLMQGADVGPVVTIVQDHYPPDLRPELRWSAGRTTATFDGNPNSFATFLVITLSATVSMVAARRRSLPPLSRLLIAAFVPLGALALLTTGSKSGFVAMGGALAMLIVLAPRRPRRFIVMALILAIPLFILVTNAIDIGRVNRVTSNYALSVEDRLETWQANLKGFYANPVFGSGRSPDLTITDSQYVLELRERGMLGLLALGVLLTLIVRKALFLYRSTVSSPFEAGLALGVLTMTSGLLINGIASTVFIGQRTGEVFWIFVGLLISSVAIRSREQSRGATIPGHG